jgi:hypothetical protein
LSILFTFNGIEVVSIPDSPGWRSIDWGLTDYVAASSNPFNADQQIFDWGQSLLSPSVQLPPMTRDDGDRWAAFLMQCRGMTRAFLLGDPSGKTPKGSNLTTGASPLIDGAGQSGYSISTKGWQASKTGVLKAGDWVQLIYRLHKVLDDVDSDASGKATIAIYPPVRETPADGQAIVTVNAQGLFRLASNTNKFSVGLANIYGFDFACREAF